MIDISPLFATLEHRIKFFDGLGVPGKPERTERGGGPALAEALRAFDERKTAARRAIASAIHAAGHPALGTSGVYSVAIARLTNEAERLDALAGNMLEHSGYATAQSIRLGSEAWAALADAAESVGIIGRMVADAANANPAIHPDRCLSAEPLQPA